MAVGQNQGPWLTTENEQSRLPDMVNLPRVGAWGFDSQPICVEGTPKKSMPKWDPHGQNQVVNLLHVIIMQV